MRTSIVLVCFFALGFSVVAGCGGSAETGVVAEQDELSAYLAENPSDPEDAVTEDD